ncbi:GTP-binding protein Rhes [Lampris incognitus]|uniref:GTP-binding protein Rhes n=1 Tax=Lampris incognitus TaxID=2546036 RepID=UPI0024B4D4C6|nr:GTP-binding protein Rhes [Lampris incognitus]
MNTTEKFYLSVDGIAETFKPCADHHQLGLRTAGGKKIPLPKLTSLHRKSSPSPSRRLQSKVHSQHPSNPGVKVSNISKASMGIIKTVRARWRQRDKRGGVARSSSTGDQRPSSDRLRRRRVEPLTTPALTKPRNCRRIVVLGAPKVGKTNILQRFLGGEFEEHYEPTSEDFSRKLYQIRGETYQIDIVDAARERDFPAKRRLTILTGDIFLLVFSLDDRGTLTEVCELRDEIRAAKAKLMKPKDAGKVPVVICGNKADLRAQRVVGRSETEGVLGEGAAFFETSAKEGTGLEDVFGALAALGGLPVETSPSAHRTVSVVAYQSLRAVRRPGAPCAAVFPLARRPSFRSDLRQVLGPSAKPGKTERCHVQ